MTGLSAGDEFLLDQIRQGNTEGWAQLVQRYQGRLLAFARSQLGGAAESEDLVQEVFLQFLQGVKDFRAESSLETFLFMILRRRIIDHLRRRGRVLLSSCMVRETCEGDQPAEWGLDQIADDQVSVAGQLIRGEEAAGQQRALREALEQLVGQLQASLKFRDLQVLELTFYAQLRNKDIARLMGMDEKQVALLKHRMIQRVSQSLQQQPSAGRPPLDDTMLTRLWEQLRPSCPKRSTLGKALLGTLDDDWQAYVDFHLHQLGCRFCLANLEDLKPQPAVEASAYQRILQSSVGFFRPR